MKLPRRAIAVDGVAGRVIQAPKQEPRIMRYELSDYEWVAITPFLPNKPRGVPRVNDRRVLNGILWVLRSGAPCAICRTILAPIQLLQSLCSLAQGWRVGPAYQCVDRRP
jgi:hypothetical protein